MGLPGQTEQWGAGSPSRSADTVFHIVGAWRSWACPSPCVQQRRLWYRELVDGREALWMNTEAEDTCVTGMLLTEPATLQIPRRNMESCNGAGTRKVLLHVSTEKPGFLTDAQLHRAASLTHERSGHFWAKSLLLWLVPDTC